MAGRGLVTDPAPPEGLILVDTPPPAVAGDDGRPAAIVVLEAADACVFVASGIRYADAAGWELIDVAARRHLPTLFVLNRLPAAPEIQQLLQDDFTRRLAARGALADPGAGGVVGVAEGPILPDSGGLPPEWVSGLRKELEALADPLARRRTVARVAGAAVRQVRRGLDAVRTSLVDEAVAALALSDAVDAELPGGGRRTSPGRFREAAWRRWAARIPEPWRRWWCGAAAWRRAGWRRRGRPGRRGPACWRAVPSCGPTGPRPPRRRSGA